MEAFRLVREAFSGTLSGIGCGLYGGRWNSSGIELIYTSLNRSLAMAEVVVHFDILTIPDEYLMMTLYIPDDISLKKMNQTDLPPNWNDFPSPSSNLIIGDRFVFENQYCVLMIPSSVTKGDYNSLINPNHRDFARINIINTEKFPFDKRIFK